MNLTVTAAIAISMDLFKLIYLAELFRQATFYLAELFRQITSPFFKILFWNFDYTLLMKGKQQCVHQKLVCIEYIARNSECT